MEHLTQSFVLALSMLLAGFGSAQPVLSATKQPDLLIYQPSQLDIYYPTNEELDRFTEPDERLDKRTFYQRYHPNDALTMEQDDAVNDYNSKLEKRSVAVGRMNFRPAKRSIVIDRNDEYRTAKRSAATGRSEFRPAKRFLVDSIYSWV